MADIRYQALSADGQTIAEINGQTLDSKTNGEIAIGAGFILGITQGVVTITIKATAVLPVAGHSIDLMDLHLSQLEIPLGFYYNGKIYVFPAKLTELSKKDEAKNGMVTGDFTFMQAGPAAPI